jgi:hypothetical protein
MAMTRLEQVSSIEGVKLLAEIMHIAEQSGELQLVHRSPLVLMLIRG